MTVSPRDITVSQHTVTTISFDDIELPVQFKPVEGNATVINRVSDNTIVVGYLVQDEDCQNPLESADGQGNIYTDNRRNKNHNPEAILDALGYSSDGEPNYELLDGSVEREKYVDYFIENTTVEDCERHGWVKDDELTDKEFIEACAIEDYEEHGGSVHSEELDAIKHDLWMEGRANGTIGEPYAIDVNYMEHGYSSYHAQKPGQSVLEYSDCNALWVPDAIATDNIEYQAIQSLLPAGTRVEYMSTDVKLNDITYILPNGDKQGGFTSFVDAIKAAAAKLDASLTLQQIHEAGKNFAYEYAKGVCTEYTQWANGETYGVVVETYHRTPVDEWESVNQDSCWGYIGSNWANEALNEAVENAASESMTELAVAQNADKPGMSKAIPAERLAGLQRAAQADPEHGAEHDQDHEAE